MVCGRRERVNGHNVKDTSIPPHHLIGAPHQAVHCVITNDHGAPLHANPATRSDSDEDRVLALGVIAEFDHLVQENANGGHAHSVGHGQNGTYFVQGVPARQGTDVVEAEAGGQFKADLVHQEVGKVLHALGSSAHANELRGLKDL